MKAFRLTEWQTPGSWQDVPEPEPGPGQVLVKMGGAGACHSDLHLMHEWTPQVVPALAAWRLPFTLGHENAGWVAGGDAGPLDEGTPVVVSPTWSCGVCAPCRAGDTSYCEDPVCSSRSGGLGLDGGLAPLMLAPRAALVPLGDLPPWKAAPLADAGLTSYHAVKRCLPQLAPGSTAVLIGVGGVGHMAIEFLRELCATCIVAVDRDERSLTLARERGAHLCLLSDATTAREIKQATGGLGASAVFDFVGADDTLKLATRVARRRGQIVLVGMGGGELRVAPGALPDGCSVGRTLGGSTGELAEVVALAEAGRIETEIERFPLDHVAEVYAQLAAHEIRGRAVLMPSE